MKNLSGFNFNSKMSETKRSRLEFSQVRCCHCVLQAIQRARGRWMMSSDITLQFAYLLNNAKNNNTSISHHVTDPDWLTACQTTHRPCPALRRRPVSSAAVQAAVPSVDAACGPRPRSPPD